MVNASHITNTFLSEDYTWIVDPSYLLPRGRNDTTLVEAQQKELLHSIVSDAQGLGQLWRARRQQPSCPEPRVRAGAKWEFSVASLCSFSALGLPAAGKISARRMAN